MRFVSTLKWNDPSVGGAVPAQPRAIERCHSRAGIHEYLSAKRGKVATKNLSSFVLFVWRFACIKYAFNVGRSIVELIWGLRS